MSERPRFFRTERVIVTIVFLVFAIVAAIRQRNASGDEVIRDMEYSGRIEKIRSFNKGYLKLYLRGQDQLVRLIPAANREEYRDMLAEKMGLRVRVGDSIFKPKGIDSVFLFSNDSVFRYRLIVLDKR
jgi:hypothetical protein